jgi:hypothetical protein
MWGNKQGWFISVIIAGVMGWLIWSLGRPEGISKPSGEFVLTNAIRLPVSPQEAMPGVMTDPSDAGDLYWQAIEAYRADPKPYDTFAVANARQATKLAALDPVLRATSADKASIFIKKPDTLINYEFPRPELDALVAVGQLCNSLGHYYVKSEKNADPVQATKYLNAGFSLGAKLYAERLTHGELMAGFNLMQGAADSLRELARRQGDKAREDQLKRFSDAASNYYKGDVHKLYDKVNSTGREDIGRYAGDVFELARNNPDRMWQVEAILKIGRYRFNATRMADQVGAERMLGDNPAQFGYRDFEQSDDPAVRTAGRAARELSEEQYRMMR